VALLHSAPAYVKATSGGALAAAFTGHKRAALAELAAKVAAMERELRTRDAALKELCEGSTTVRGVQPPCPEATAAVAAQATTETEAALETPRPVLAPTPPCDASKAVEAEAEAAPPRLEAATLLAGPLASVMMSTPATSRAAVASSCSEPAGQVEADACEEVTPLMSEHALRKLEQAASVQECTLAMLAASSRASSLSPGGLGLGLGSPCASTPARGSPLGSLSDPALMRRAVAAEAEAAALASQLAAARSTVRVAPPSPHIGLHSVQGWVVR
jgi:hypothetical protein